MFEAEYERVILQEAGALFPGRSLVEFKPLVVSAESKGRPDLALVDIDFGNWWVVEVELGHHPLHQHVLPQVETFSRGLYGSEHADYLARHLDESNLPKLESMMRGTQPKVIVVVNEPKPSWVPDLRRFGALLMVMELLRSDRNRFAIRANGDLLPLPRHSLSRCKTDPLVPRLMRVESPGGLPEGLDELAIQTEAGISTWKRVDVANAVYLTPTRSSLAVVGEFDLHIDESGRLSLHKIGGTDEY